MKKVKYIIIMNRLTILFLLFTTTVNATEVYFTPSNDCQEQIIKLIDKAQNNINIAIYSFTDNKIYNTLVKKKNIVKIIADNKQSKGKSSKIDLLSFNNVKVCKRLSGVMHNKYMIIDDKYVITGSYNWSDGARKSNNENCIVINDIDVIKKYQKNFNELSLKYCK